MKQDTPARARFRELTRAPESQLDLVAAVLAIALEDQQLADYDAALHQLDAITAGARARLRNVRRPAELVATLNVYLFDELGFYGNTTNYSDPANSFFDRVLDTRTGLPIMLSIMYIELGRRLRLPISGVALPGHFLVRYAAPNEDIYIDPFHGGRVWQRAECEAHIVAAYGDDARPLIERIMQPPTKREIISRVLRNLKNAYVEAECFEQALAVVERLLLLEPADAEEIRDRGVIRANLGHLHLALHDLDIYAALLPDAPDLPAMRVRAQYIAEHLVKAS